MKFLPVIVVLLLAQTAFADNLYSLRKPILMDYGPTPQLYVTFNHSSHKRVACRLCHHMPNEEGKRFVKCTIEPCHSLQGSRQRNPMSAFMAYHDRESDRSCYGCHLEKRARHPSFRGCQPCHMGPLTRASLEKDK